MNAIEKVLGSAKIGEVVNIKITCEGKEIVNQQSKVENLLKSTRKFVNHVNILTCDKVEKDCILTVNGVSFKFVGGKFANNLGKLCKIYVIQNVLFSDNLETEKVYRDTFYKYIDENVKSILDIVNLIKYVNTLKLDGLKLCASTLKLNSTNE